MTTIENKLSELKKELQLQVEMFNRVEKQITWETGEKEANILGGILDSIGKEAELLGDEITYIEYNSKNNC